MLVLKNVFEIANKVQEENKKRNLERKNEKSNLERITPEIFSPSGSMINYETENCSNKLLETIRDLGLTIKGYAKGNFLRYGPEYKELLEIYLCEYGPWEFNIKHFSDVDIEEGLFIISQLNNLVNGETIKLFLDLGCQTNSMKKLETFKSILKHDSKESFIKNRYKNYLDIPELLHESNLSIIKNTLKFNILDISGYLELFKDVYLRMIVEDSGDTVQIAITNSKTWNNGFLFPANEKGVQVYNVDYVDKSNLPILIETIYNFFDHINGKVGFFENGIYHSNSHFEEFLNSFRDKEYIKAESWEKDDIEIIKLEDWNNPQPFINKMTGIELYSDGEIIFNSSEDSCCDNISMGCYYTIIYDKKEHPEYCRLIIVHFTSDIDGRSIKEHQTFHGKYIELCEIIEKYVKKMSEIFEI